MVTFNLTLMLPAVQTMSTTGVDHSRWPPACMEQFEVRCGSRHAKTDATKGDEDGSSHLPMYCPISTSVIWGGSVESAPLFGYWMTPKHPRRTSLLQLGAPVTPPSVKHFICCFIIRSRSNIHIMQIDYAYCWFMTGRPNNPNILQDKVPQC